MSYCIPSPYSPGDDATMGCHEVCDMARGEPCSDDWTAIRVGVASSLSIIRS